MTHPTPIASVSLPVAPTHPARLQSIDALRGFVMIMMIYVNMLSSAGAIVPGWMVHFSERHANGSGLTFVDLVFPAFLFIAGMSIPFARQTRGAAQPSWGRSIGHICKRTVALLFIGVMMVNESPDAAKMGWSVALWSTLMYLSAIAAFGDFVPGNKSGLASPLWTKFSVGLRSIGLVSLGLLAFVFIGADGHRIITLSPFSIHHEWWGILGLIGWAYLIASLVFLLFRGERVALLGSMALLLCLFAADRAGTFNGLWLAAHVSVGETLGSQAAITVGGMLLGSMLLAPEMSLPRARIRFTLWFIAATAAAALLLNGLYGISKNNATPSWCLWACAVSATLWLLMYFVVDLRSQRFIAKPLVAAGQNVLLAYLLSELLPSLLTLAHFEGSADTSLAFAIARSAGISVAIISLTIGLNHSGFRVKL